MDGAALVRSGKTAPVADESGKSREPSVLKPPADSEQVRRTRDAAQRTVDDVAATTERILRASATRASALRDPQARKPSANRRTQSRRG